MRLERNKAGCVQSGLFDRFLGLALEASVAWWGGSNLPKRCSNYRTSIAKEKLLAPVVRLSDAMRQVGEYETGHGDGNVE